MQQTSPKVTDFDNQSAASSDYPLPRLTSLLTRKENSSWNSSSCLWLCLCYHFPSTSQFRTINQIPFRWQGSKPQLIHFRSSLGSIYPQSSAVSMEPFSTSVFKVHMWIFATTTKICTHRFFTFVRTKASSTLWHPPTHSNKSNLLKWSTISHSLERHPFSGLVHSAGELLHTP